MKCYSILLVEDTDDDAKPKAIYIGRDCSAKNADCLFDIADEHEAKIYKMDFNDYLNNYELVYKEFQK